MVMADDRPSHELESREPSVEDLRDLCRELNQRSARYVVVGGFAMRALSSGCAGDGRRRTGSARITRRIRISWTAVSTETATTARSMSVRTVSAL